jgi:hypothetical protein
MPLASELLVAEEDGVTLSLYRRNHK